MFEDEDVFPLLVNPHNLDHLCQLPGHTDITKAWANFWNKRPEAKQFETQLNPPPWTELRAQPFQFIRNEDLEKLYTRWSQQVNVLLEMMPTQ